MANTQQAVEVATALEKALYAENDRLHADAKRWPEATAIALLQAKTYAHRARRFLSVGAVAEAKTAFDTIAWPKLHAVFDACPDLAIAAARLREALGRP